MAFDRSMLGSVVVIVLTVAVQKSGADECQVAQTCVTDFSVADCWGTEILQPNAHIYNCCPICQQPASTAPPLPLPLPIFPVGCRPPSNCLPDGRYAPVQCKGELFTGRCFCSDEDGNRIFGQMWRTEARDMTCACSARRAKLEATERRSVTLHCTATGDYEPLQCDDGMCWCAQPRTGQPTAGPIPEEDMRRLPCYSSSQLGSQYLRQCESVVQASATIRQEQSIHGTNFLGGPPISCFYDGSYGPYTVRSGIAYCSGRDGEILGAWQVLAGERSRMNCNCALDTAIHFPERGMAVSETCQANGNYVPNQNVDGVYYCVDTDGYPTTDYLEQWPTDNCQSFAQ